MPNPTESVDSDELYSILGNPRRRWLIYYLIKQDGSANLKTASRSLTATELNTTSDAVINEEVRPVYNSLYSNHLPRLEECSIVTYDQTDGMVHLDDRMEDILDIVVDSRRRHRRWAAYYLSVGVGITVILLMIQTSPFPARKGYLPSAVIGAALSLVILASIRYYQERRRLPAEKAVEALVSSGPENDWMD